MFTLCTYTGTYLVDYYLKQEQKVGMGINRTAKFSILYGILVGLLTGIRIGGLFFIFFVFLTHLLVLVGKRDNYKKIFGFTICYIFMFVAWMVTVILWHPASWANPVEWFFETIGYLSKHPLPIKTLFDGKLLPIQNIPWYFTPKWILLTTPLIFQISFVVGIVFIISKYQIFSDIQRCCVVLVLLQIFFLPLVAIIKNSSDYDDLRHFMFVIPGIAVIAAAALIWIYQLLSRNKILQIAGVTLIVPIFAQIILDMVSLHPYEYVYFNRVSGGLAAAQNRYEIDYWGLSLREGMEWVNKNASPNETVLVGGVLYSAKIFAAPNLNVIDAKEAQETVIPKPYYYLPWGRWHFPSLFPECKVVHQVVRQGVPLSIVKRCE